MNGYERESEVVDRAPPLDLQLTKLISKARWRPEALRELTHCARCSFKIHVLGTHIHPHTISIELYNVSRKETVWKGTRGSGNTGNSMAAELVLKGMCGL